MSRPFHPILFALYPVLALYALNTALIPISDVLLPALLVVAATIGCWGILAIVLRNTARAAAGASVAVVCVFANGHLWDLVIHNKSLSSLFYSRNDMTQYWAALTFIAVVLACWRWKRSDHLSGAMNIVGIVLAGVPAIAVATSLFNAWRGTSVRTVEGVAAKLNITVRPDIYYIILDGYGRSDALKRVIGTSNDSFIKGLEDRGFYVAKDARSNYCETELSLSSSLNLDYLPKILPELKESWESRGVLDNLIDKNGVARYLRKIGYRYEAMTSGFPAVHPKSADLWLQDTKGISLFAGALLSETPFSNTDFHSASQFDARRAMLKSALQNAVKSSAGAMMPKFVFVHVLAPHPPFVFGPNGEQTKPKKMGFALVDGSHFYENGGTPAEYATGYAGQVAYINKLVLRAVDEILNKSAKQPVIIIQGDHGSKLRLDQEYLDRTDVNECFPNLNAFLVPPKVRTKLYSGITPVNSFRLLFNGLFGDKFAKLPDRSYYSSWSAPFRFTDVTNRIRNRSSSRQNPTSQAQP